MADWEQKAAIEVHKRVAAFILAGRKQHPSVGFSAELGGRHVSEAWSVEVFRNVENPKPSYVADWDELPAWQRQTNVEIYAAIGAGHGL